MRGFQYSRQLRCGIYIRDACQRERLALTEDLNLVVISFREETDKHNSMMAEIWMSVLKECREQEMSKYKARYRENSTYAKRIRTEGAIGFGVQRCGQGENRRDVSRYAYLRSLQRGDVRAKIPTSSPILEDVIRTTWRDISNTRIKYSIHSSCRTTTIRTRPCPHLRTADTRSNSQLVPGVEQPKTKRQRVKQES
jgi:hypothetical protein